MTRGYDLDRLLDAYFVEGTNEVADRVIELGSGRIVSDGPPAGGRVAMSSLRW